MEISQRILFYIILSYITLFFISCNEGLSPPKVDEATVIKGKINFTSGLSSWPSLDSLKDLRIAFFQNYPDSANILNDFVTGNLTFTEDSIPYFVESYEFIQIVKKVPVEFNYICVAQNYAGLLEWKVIGLYSINDDNITPKKLIIDKEGIYNNININVNFNNLPPQPF
jgi:hypothetical protein